MSERGSFVTEYIYDQRVFEACKKVLCEDHKYLKGVVIPVWSGCEQQSYLPIIAGKIGGLYGGEELIDMEYTYIPEIQKLMPDGKFCRICVMSNTAGERVFEFTNKSIKYIRTKDGIYQGTVLYKTDCNKED